jgi:hypothetical protein
MAGSCANQRNAGTVIFQMERRVLLRRNGGGQEGAGLLMRATP